jgi:hypothetical protein
MTERSRDSLVGIVTGYGLGGPGSTPGIPSLFSSPHVPMFSWALLVSCPKGTGGNLPGDKAA